MMMKLAGKDFKIEIINMLKNVKTNMNVMSREVEYIKYNQRKFLCLINNTF